MSNGTATAITCVSFSFVMIVLLFAGSAKFATAQSNTTKTLGLVIDNKTYPFSYSFTNGGTLNLEPFLNENHALDFNITTSQDTNLVMVFPRQAADALLLEQSPSPIIFLGDINIETNPPTVFQYDCDRTTVSIPVDASWSGQNVLFEWGVPPFGNPNDYHEYNFVHILHLNKTIQAAGKNFTLGITTDSKKCDVSFSQQEKKVHVDIKGRDDLNDTTSGTFTIYIPNTLIGGNYSVLVDGKPGLVDTIRPYTENITDITLSYPKNASGIDIYGTTAIPEFPSELVLTSVASMSVAIVIVLGHRSLASNRSAA